ncbi:hypothetical protein M409DRAFT_59447 [Zasmidium cellare ATCC 36951]|uniref:Uncharacterized protein n=1 Tax=Zasmidium cellare ATCC 36951 TaxID=1080233 RepID=A0A6A6C3P9_ZASCE|nr:uncharacterized protein M409DRAFT_59447 [Zasmidium cellare ATCC 36951]KAF2160918.1 hypothetical protein M409DRAFT_59447 [Zasmidium cellare ATCC 36951]
MNGAVHVQKDCIASRRPVVRWTLLAVNQPARYYLVPAKIWMVPRQRPQAPNQGLLGSKNSQNARAQFLSQPPRKAVEQRQRCGIASAYICFVVDCRTSMSRTSERSRPP